MLRIAEGKSLNGSRVLRLEGRVVDRWVEELRRVCGPDLGEARPLLLDVSGVSFLDPGGIDLLRGLQDQGAVIIHASPFVKEQLTAPADETPAEREP